MYRPFLPKRRVAQLIEDMKGNKAVSIHMRIGEMAGGICKEFGIRVCLSCMEEDKKMYGESYIHRIHQVPGNQICNKHSEVLKKIILPKYLGKNQLVDFSVCEIEQKNFIVNDNNFEYFKNLSQDISKIFEDTLYTMNFEDIFKKYKVMLMKKGFASIGGIIKWDIVEKSVSYTHLTLPTKA